MTHETAVATHAAERYLLDEMPELERFQFEEHYFACATCAEEVRLGGVMREGVAQGLVGGLRAEDGTRSTEHGTRMSEGAGWTTDTRAGADWTRVLPWAVAATLALATGYQTLVVVPGLREQVLGPQALAPLTLRPASRGADTELARPAAGVVSFALDVNGVAAGTPLAYDLRAADGTSVASGSTAAPPPGAPLLLLVPVTALPAGSYTLWVTAAGDSGTVTDYRFTLRDR